MTRAVVNIVQRGQTIRAAVEGSQYEPYEVRIDLDETGVVATRCSCPYDHGGICKHRVAVLLTYIRDPDEIEQRPPVSELIADANPEDLRKVLIDLGENHPKVAEHIESRLGAKGTDDESDETRDRTPDVNQDSIRYPVARSKSNRQTERPGPNPGLHRWSWVNDGRFLIEMAESADRSL